MKRKMPEEYENVLVTSPEGKLIVAHRNGTRWYGYTLLDWLQFEPTEFTPLNDISTLRAENARLKERCEALEELVEALERYAKTETDNLYARIPGSLGLGRANKEELQALQLEHDKSMEGLKAARAKLAALGE